MIVFDTPTINPEKTPEENIKVIRSFLEETVDKLNMLSEQVDKSINEREDK